MGKRMSKLFIVLIVFFIAQLLLFSFQQSSSSQPPDDRDPQGPQQVHISLAGKDHVRISWVTTNENSSSIVKYGKLPEEQVANATGERTSYKFFSYTSGQIHRVKIGPLDPNTTYYYTCGGSGPEFNFKTPPLSFPLEFAVVGDLGQTEWTVLTLANIGARDHDVFLLPGDMSYADGRQELWDSFDRMVEPLASRRPWMVAEGNHDAEAFSSDPKEDFLAYNHRWHMPHQESGSPSNAFYSFDVSGSHVIALGCDVEFYVGSEQYRWLEVDLARVDRKLTPWLIVVLHEPWYNTNFAHRREGQLMRGAMEKMLYEARVDIVFAGHVHAYERFARIYDKKPNPCGPVFLTVGGGGNHEGLASMFEKPQPSLSQHREASFGHGRLRLLNGTHSHWSWRRNSNSSDSVVADSVLIESLSSSRECMETTLSFRRDEL